ncbi:MAG: undecaprenyl-diphosphate phosphatase [Syntrophomonadaceae bacterium]|nr:undecaprenyl-diphosphate phosphatase [Syntrophomonadaceae bacterium]
MTIWHAIVLGMVQGFTEFIPVSSSGHLIIFQYILGIQENPLAFDLLVDVGTLAALFIALRHDIVSIIKKPFSKITCLIIVGCIPAGLIGYYLQPLLDQAWDSLLMVGIGLIVTGVILKFSDIVAHNGLNMKDEFDTTYGNALFIGLMQCIAIIPGISRSGFAIVAGLVAGLDRNFAARYSFLLSIPVILGAALVQIKDASSLALTGSVLPYAAGLLTAAVTGFVAIKIIIKVVSEGRISIFSYYCWLVGTLAIAAQLYFKF